MLFFAVKGILYIVDLIDVLLELVLFCSCIIAKLKKKHCDEGDVVVCAHAPFY